MVTPRIIMPYYASGKQSWMPFGVKIPAWFRVISGDSEENISTLLRRLTSEDQCLSLEPTNSGIQLAWDVQYRLWNICGEKGSDRISYSEIRYGGLPPGTTMHGKRQQALRRQGPSIQQMKKMRMSPLLPRGAKRIMGVARRQDEALPVDQFLLIVEIAEKDWSK